MIIFCLYTGLVFLNQFELRLKIKSGEKYSNLWEGI